MNFKSQVFHHFQAEVFLNSGNKKYPYSSYTFPVVIKELNKSKFDIGFKIPGMNDQVCSKVSDLKAYIWRQIRGQLFAFLVYRDKELK